MDHPGISLMKPKIWWPKIDELSVMSFDMCEDSANMPQAMALNPWQWLGGTWFQVHMDYVGPVKSKFSDYCG